MLYKLKKYINQQKKLPAIVSQEALYIEWGLNYFLNIAIPVFNQLSYSSTLV